MNTVEPSDAENQALSFVVVCIVENSQMWVCKVQLWLEAITKLSEAIH